MWEYSSHPQGLNPFLMCQDEPSTFNYLPGLPLLSIWTFSGQICYKIYFLVVKIMYPSTELMSLATLYSIITGKVGLFDTYFSSWWIVKLSSGQ